MRITLSLLAMFGAASSWSKVSVRFDGSGNSGSVKVVFSIVLKDTYSIL